MWLPVGPAIAMRLALAQVLVAEPDRVDLGKLEPSAGVVSSPPSCLGWFAGKEHTSAAKGPVRRRLWVAAAREMMGMKRTALVVLLMVTAAMVVTAAPAGALGASSAAALSTSDVAADFNNDGFADLAVGVPGEDVGSVVDAGAVNVLYGSGRAG